MNMNMNKNKLIELVNGRGDLNVTFEELDGNKAVILTDGETYTLFSEDDGGVIVSDVNLDKAKVKFIESMYYFNIINPIIKEVYLPNEN